MFKGLIRLAAIVVLACSIFSNALWSKRVVFVFVFKVFKWE
jgi:hypothetical protein